YNPITHRISVIATKNVMLTERAIIGQRNGATLLLKATKTRTLVMRSKYAIETFGRTSPTSVVSIPRGCI
ncbi:hypothetical protein PMAYCL1PPCAC_11601, partial [Pristionchus mayeri]